MDALDTHFVSSVENAVQESLRENKALLVYTSGEDNSWFESWFTPLVGEQLKDTCVWLRLAAGSREMGYFEQIFPDVRVPSVYCIANGQILEKISPEQLDMDGFATRLIRAVGKSERNVEEADDADVPSSAGVISDAGARTGSYVSQNEKSVEHQIKAKKQQLTEQQERQRIVRLMKADREEMKQRRLSSSSPNATEEQVSQVLSIPIHDNIKNRDIINAAVCTLLIRLTDGKTLKNDFESSQTLNEVRLWVDSNRTDKDGPYQFHRNVPRETFTESQELLSLKSLELTPRSALILKPLEEHTYSRKIADVEGPGLLGKMYQNVTSWWYGKPHGGKQTNFEAVATSAASSRYVSPLSSPLLTHSDDSLPPRSFSPTSIHNGHAADDNNARDS
ncbi:unnamed protein product [Kluyveromyces dobzhanskii CBS 2104]|uniref:WGS project CCBQ000000000 data, contig 00272 n=1 Tax=Kluyveromyces dobzhanskii CBS 2104 TaxID=1427455 RepID=A0A0A8L8R0_9SACH|nr:unnamed protein product [Kluyveromyces dobzhanskii CBS 2104]